MKKCLCDLKYCVTIENAGFSFLLKLKALVLEHGGTFSIINASKELKKQARLANLKSLFQ